MIGGVIMLLNNIDKNKPRATAFIASLCDFSVFAYFFIKIKQTTATAVEIKK